MKCVRLLYWRCRFITCDENGKFEFVEFCAKLSSIHAYYEWVVIYDARTDIWFVVEVFKSRF